MSLDKISPKFSLILSSFIWEMGRTYISSWCLGDKKVLGWCSIQASSDPRGNVPCLHGVVCYWSNLWLGQCPGGSLWAMPHLPLWPLSNGSIQASAVRCSYPCPLGTLQTPLFSSQPLLCLPQPWDIPLEASGSGDISWWYFLGTKSSLGNHTPLSSVPTIVRDLSSAPQKKTRTCLTSHALTSGSSVSLLGRRRGFASLLPILSPSLYLFFFQRWLLPLPQDEKGSGNRN